MYKQKLSSALILFVSALIIASCGGSVKKEVKTEEQKEATLMEVPIGGMMCTGCEQTIQNNVGKLEGIKSVKAYCSTGIAMIECIDGMADTTRIRVAINGSGYTVKKFTALTKEEGEH